MRSIKNIRYYYWIITAFSKKHARLILLSFLVSIVTIVGLLSIAPYVLNYTTSQQEIIGLVGNPDYTTLPDEILGKISNGLLFINEKGEVIPTLADSWEQIDNGKEYRIKLKKNLFWNDGTPFTARDVNYTFKDVEKKVIDELTISFKLKKTLPVFPTYLTTAIIKYPLVGVAGLYKVDRIKSRYGTISEVYLSPNKDDLPAYTYKFFPSEGKVVDAYKLSEINQMTILKKSVADAFATWKNTEVTKMVDYNSLLTLFFNMKNEMLKSDKDIRQAISMSLNKSTFTEVGEEALGPIPPISWAYNPLLKQVPYDPDLARRILRNTGSASEEAGLQLSTSYELVEKAEEIKSSFAEAGLRVNIHVLSGQAEPTFDMLLAYWKVPLDPDQYYFWHSTQNQGNITSYNNVKIDKLLEDGRSTIDVAERKQIYDQFQRVLQDDQPAVFLYYPYSYTIKRK